MDLVKYGSLIETFKVDDRLPAEKKAYKLWQMLIFAKRSRDGLFLVIGKILKQIRDEKLYRQLDFRTFKEFIASEEVSFSRETAYMYIKTYEYYIEYLQLDPDFIGQIDISKLSRMVHLLKQIPDKEKVVEQIERLSKLRYGDFVKEIQHKGISKFKPTVKYDEEHEKWVVTYWGNKTMFVDLGDYYEEDSPSGLIEEINKYKQKTEVFE